MLHRSGVQATPPYRRRCEPLGAALPPAPTTAEEVCRLDTLIGQAFAERAAAVVGRRAGCRADRLPRPDDLPLGRRARARGTLQLGQPAWIAEGPVCRWSPTCASATSPPAARARRSCRTSTPPAGRHRRPAGALNLGGISNITVVSPGRAPTIAFDIGPANALIDAAAPRTRGATAYDRGGAPGRHRPVDAGLLERLLSEPYYRRPPPKSTGKELFHLDYLLDHVAAVGSVDADDLVATVTELTAVTVAEACRDFDVRRLLVSGGGAENPLLMERLVAALPDVVLTMIDTYGIPSAAKEAYLRPPRLSHRARPRRQRARGHRRRAGHGCWARSPPAATRCGFRIPKRRRCGACGWRQRRPDPTAESDNE